MGFKYLYPFRLREKAKRVKITSTITGMNGRTRGKGRVNCELDYAFEYKDGERVSFPVKTDKRTCKFVYRVHVQ